MVIELAVLAVLVTASTAHAETTQVLALVGSIDQVLTNIRTWVMGILASLATVFLSIGGVRYVMGGGNPGEIEKAKTALKSAAIGYGLAALAPLSSPCSRASWGPNRCPRPGPHTLRHWWRRRWSRCAPTSRPSHVRRPPGTGS